MLTRLLAYVRGLLGQRRISSEADDELQFHIEQETAVHVARGASPVEARRLALRDLGGVAQVREAVREARRPVVSFLASIGQDLRYGVRSLNANRGFAAAVLVTLTIGVGLNTTLFAVLNGFLLKPWSLPDPAGLVRAFTWEGERSFESASSVPAAHYRFLRDHSALVDLVAIAQTGPMARVDDEVSASRLRYVSGNYFDVLRVQLSLGRGFRTEEDIPGSPIAVAVIGHRLWQEHWGSSPNAIGGTVRLNGLPFEIVGVAAPGAMDSPLQLFPTAWVPLAAYPLLGPSREFDQNFLFNPEYCCVDLAGRLRRGATREAVEAELTGLYLGLSTSGEVKARGILVAGTTGIEQSRHDGTALVGLVAAGVGLVLLVACANVGNLQLARASRRQHEILIRRSLGAARGRIVRQLLTEGMLLAGAAAALSLLCAGTLPHAVSTLFAPGRMSEVAVDLSPDWRVVTFGVTLASMAVVVTGLGPALRSTRRLIGAGQQIVGDGRTPVRAWFLAIQIGLSAILLVGAALLGRGALVAGSFAPGFDAAGVAQVNILLPPGRPAQDRIDTIGDRLRQGLATQGKSSFADANPGQIAPGLLKGSGETRPPLIMQVSPGYLELLGVPVIGGRLLRESDTSADVVINESLARLLSPSASVVGRIFPGSPPYRVVGVVGDMRRPTGRPVPTVFQRGGGALMYVRNSPEVVARARMLVQSVEPRAVVVFAPMADDFARQLYGPRVAAVFAWGLGLVSVGMAALGVFGVFSFAVHERRREIGVRMALGADARKVVYLVLSHAGRAMAVGIGGGFAAAMAASPLLRDYLIGVGPRDPLAYVVAAAVLIAAGLAATIVPVRRALRVDPAISLRHE